VTEIEKRDARSRAMKRGKNKPKRKRSAPLREGQLVCGMKQAADTIAVADSTMAEYVRRGLVESRKVRGRRFVVVASLRRLVGA
jgi:hypothetical protein